MGFKRFIEKRVEPTVEEAKVIRKNERKKMRFYCARKVA